MAVWVCVPSARSVPEVAAWAKRWQAQGYKVAVWRDQMHPDLTEFGVEIDYIRTGRYPGYARATNALIAEVLKLDPSCEWTVATGDDTDPDMAHTADEIAAQCSAYFDDWWGTAFEGRMLADVPEDPAPFSTFGVMQPTGHRWGDDPTSRAMWPNAPAYIDRIAGSPWIGRSFAERINGGKGPFWPEYRHCWSDQELQEVATKLGVFWQRRDLVHLHNHWMLKGEKEPPHLIEANKTYQRDKPLFTRRQAAGFPGSEPIA